MIDLNDVARECLAALHAHIREPLNADTTTEFGPQQLGDTVQIRQPGAPDGKVTVHLTRSYDVSFVVTSDDLALPLDDFTVNFIVPAMMAMAERIDRDTAGAGPGTHFASAPLPLPGGLPSQFVSVATDGGISLRLVLVYDMNLRSSVMTIDTLYGLAHPAALESN